MNKDVKEAVGKETFHLNLSFALFLKGLEEYRYVLMVGQNLMKEKKVKIKMTH